MPSKPVYKLMRATELVALVSSGRFQGSADDERDGFIHLSSPSQMAGTLERHFTTERSIYLVALDETSLGANLRWDPSRGGALFPHLYRALVVADVVLIRPVPDGGRAEWCANLSQG